MFLRQIHLITPLLGGPCRQGGPGPSKDALKRDSDHFVERLRGVLQRNSPVFYRSKLLFHFFAWKSEKKKSILTRKTRVSFRAGTRRRVARVPLWGSFAAPEGCPGPFVGQLGGYLGAIHPCFSDQNRYFIFSLRKVGTFHFFAWNSEKNETSILTRKTHGLL